MARRCLLSILCLFFPAAGCWNWNEGVVDGGDETAQDTSVDDQAVDAADGTDPSDGDAADMIEVVDGIDAADNPDAPDAPDSPDVPDAPDTVDLPDPVDPADAPDAADAADLIDTADILPDEEPPRCPAAALGARIGRDRFMVGGSMDDASFALAPFDLRYRYLAGDVPDPGPCAQCNTGCFVRGASCANSAGCDWWGCWQYDMDPPGRYVADFLNATRPAGAVPMISYYVWFSVAGDVEGGPEVSALNDGARVSRYLADLRFLSQVMHEDPTITAMLQIEPDLWGYGEQVNQNPDMIPAAVSAAGASECASLPDTLAGLAGCMLAIARSEAPNVLAGFHVSAWGAGADALINDNPTFDLAGHAVRTAQFMQALGAGGADFFTVEMSDRDAGYNGRWWDATNASLPNFSQAASWAGTVGDTLGLAYLWWQIPYGHMGMPNACDQYEDNRVAYFFDNPVQFAAAGAFGIAFGAGAGCMTTPETDGGYFLGRAASYFSGSPPPMCGE